MTKVHIIGAGVSGLAAAIGLSRSGHAITLYDAAKQAGGRCRSYFDDQLGHRLDNGNHLLLSGNWAVARYLDITGASDELVGPDHAAFPFIDIKTGERWVVRPGAGRLPFWLFDKTRRVPGARFGEYLRGIKVMRAAPEESLAALLDDGGALYQKFWEPFCLGVLNTHPREAQAKLLWPVLAETFLPGESHCRPRVARQGLSETFVDPALSYLERHHVSVQLGRRLRGVETSDGRVTRLIFADDTVGVTPDDWVICALPAQVVATVIPDIQVPTDFRPIVNVHFKMPQPPAEPPWLIGLTNALAQWVFVRDAIASVTISAAEAIIGDSAESLGRRVWPEVKAALGLTDEAMPACRVVKEKRATFAQTPDQVAKRSGSSTGFQNMVLCGDWTDNGLPATIEGSIRTGFKAAELVGFDPKANP